MRLRRLRREVEQFEETFWSGGSLEDLYDRVGINPADPMAASFASGMKEWRHAVDHGLPSTGAMRAGLQQRISRVMGVTAAREMGLMRSEEHTSELQSLMRNSYAVFCLQQIRSTSNR